MRGEGGEGVSQSSASLRLIELRLEAWQQAAILSDTGGNVNDVNDATGARVFQNKLINCLVAPTNFTTHPGPEVRPHIAIDLGKISLNQKRGFLFDISESSYIIIL